VLSICKVYSLNIFNDSINNQMFAKTKYCIKMSCFVWYKMSCFVWYKINLVCMFTGVEHSCSNFVLTTFVTFIQTNVNIVGNCCYVLLWSLLYSRNAWMLHHPLLLLKPNLNKHQKKNLQPCRTWVFLHLCELNAYATDVFLQVKYCSLCIF
jgi:hypothetical protein